MSSPCCTDIKYVHWLRQYSIFPQKMKGKGFLQHCWGTLISSGKSAFWSKIVWCNVYHLTNKWQPGNAVIEWNITVKPECKWKVTVWVQAALELGLAAMVVEQKKLELCMPVTKGWTLQRQAAARISTLPRAHNASWKGASGPTPAPGKCEKL